MLPLSLLMMLAGTSSAAGFCARCSAPVSLGELAKNGIKEASGIAASAIHPDLFYVHNDHKKSDTRARFFAINRQGSDQGTFELEGVKAIDWEDVAIGACGGADVEKSCLYFGDIGDGKQGRKDFAIVRVEEPKEVGKGKHLLRGAEVFPFGYPDGSHNAETLLVHPESRQITLITKEKNGQPSAIFELPSHLRAGERATATQVGTVRPPVGENKFTGGAIHPKGTGILLRTKSHVFYYPLAHGQSVAEALKSSPCALPNPGDAHGEAIGWLRSGDGFVTLSEGAHSAIHLTACGPPVAPSGR